MPSRAELTEKRVNAAAKVQEIVAKYANKQDEEWEPGDLETFNNARAEFESADEELNTVTSQENRQERFTFAASAMSIINSDGARRTRETQHQERTSRNSKDDDPGQIVWTPRPALLNYGQSSLASRGINSGTMRTPEGIPTNSRDYEKSFNRYIRTGTLNIGGMTAEDETGNSFAVLPERMSSDLIKNLDDEVYIQGLSRLYLTAGARSLGIKKRTAKASTARKGSELGDISVAEENSLRFGKRSLTPHYYIAFAQISNELLRSATIGVESLYMSEIMLSIREFIEEEYLYGDGNEGCLGLMVADAQGIPTSRDIRVETGEHATPTTNFGYESLIRVYLALKSGYTNRAIWMMHRDYIFDLMTLTDPEGHLIWQTSARDGEPDRLFGRPVIRSEWMPNTRAADQYFCLFGDFNQYGIAWDVAAIETRRLTELAARNNMTEYHFRWKMDAMALIEEAFVRGQFKSA